MHVHHRLAPPAVHVHHRLAPPAAPGPRPRRLASAVAGAAVLLAGCGIESGGSDLSAVEAVSEAQGETVRRAEATAPPVDECRELGGGWQWHGTRDHGTSSVGIPGDEDGFAEDSGDHAITAPDLDHEEFRARVEEREAAGWTEDRIHDLGDLGSDYERAVEHFRYRGTPEEYDELVSEVTGLLDAMPTCPVPEPDGD